MSNVAERPVKMRPEEHQLDLIAGRMWSPCPSTSSVILVNLLDYQPNDLKRDIILDYLGGPNLITLPLKSGDLSPADSGKDGTDSKKRISMYCCWIDGDRDMCQKIGNLSPTTTRN